MCNLKIPVYFMAAISTAILAGCATQREPDTMADIMREQASTEYDRADVKGEIAAEWERGAELVESGENNVEEGEELIESARRDLQRGREQIELGNRQIAEGNQLMQQTERRYRETLPEDTPSGYSPLSD